MNRIVLALVVVSLGVVACKKAPEPATEAPAPPPKAVNIEEAAAAPAPDAAATPANEAPSPEAAAAAAKQEDLPPDKIEPLTEQGLMMLNYAVYKFHEESGRYPKSLQEMVGKHFAKMPQTHPSERLKYNPQTGQITVEKVK